MAVHCVDVGCATGVGAGSNLTCPNEFNVVLVVVSITEIESVPAVVEVAAKVALPEASSIADEGEIFKVLSELFESCTESPARGVPDESSSVTVIVDCVVPSATTSVPVRLECDASGGLPAYATGIKNIVQNVNTRTAINV